MSPYRQEGKVVSKSKEEIKQLVDAAVAAAKVEFASHPSMTTTHDKMAVWIQDYLRQHGVSANVSYIVNVGGNPRAVGVFKVFPHPTVSEVEFETMIVGAYRE